MRTATRIRVLIMVLPAVLALCEGHGVAVPEPAPVGSRISVVQADRDEVRLVRWAATRFVSAGLEAPNVEIAFHPDVSGCGGHLGYATASRVDVCTLLVNEMSRRNLLHEMGHVWIDQNVPQTVRERFLQLRGLRAWNASTDPWEQRGSEHGAEIVAWALWNRMVIAQIPDNDPGSLAEAYELLTGTSLPPPAV